MDFMWEDLKLAEVEPRPGRAKIDRVINEWYRNQLRVN